MTPVDHPFVVGDQVATLHDMPGLPAGTVCTVVDTWTLHRIPAVAVTIAGHRQGQLFDADAITHLTNSKEEAA